MRPRWYLVQVDLSTDPDDDPLPPDTYFCTFFHRHPKDDGRPDNNARVNLFGLMMMIMSLVTAFYSHLVRNLIYSLLENLALSSTLFPHLPY